MPPAEHFFGTLALTGALTVGAAGMAGAAPASAPWDGGDGYHRHRQS